MRSKTFRGALASLGLAGALALGTALTPAYGATGTATFQVTATVSASCLISATNLSFGAYTGSVMTAASTLSVDCTTNTPYNIGLNAGTSAGATVTTRAMTGPGGATLAYALYRDGGYTQNWGNTVGTDTVAGTGTGATQTLTVYGQMPAGQLVAPGGYTDTITATISY